MSHPNDILGQLADVPPLEHRRRDRIAGMQIWLPVAALAAAGLWWTWHWLGHCETGYMPGPLAQVHASWEDRCAACHVTSEPLGADNWTTLVTQDLHAADAQCQTCHGGPPHHAKEIPGEAPGCTACHREHRGRDADLKRMANERCTSCHRDLPSHIASGAVSNFLNVTRFDADGHPELALFRGAIKDPGHVAFNHKLHLSTGLREQAATSVPFIYAEIPAEFRERYRPAGASDHAAVQLGCGACHRPDSAGAYMLPINYEQHCQACHPLSFAAGSSRQAAVVPHHLQPNEIAAWLLGHFTLRLTKDELGFLEQPARPLPGKNPEREAAARKLGALLQARIDAAQRILLGPSTCGKCHSSLRADLREAQRVETANVPTVWLSHARFGHAAHRGIACGSCHAEAAQSRSQADILLPHIQMCQKCHGPANGSTSRLAAARSDCMECHRYHDGDHAQTGRGAESR